MKKRILVVLMAFITISLSAQIEFESGYFITDEGKRVECLIKNTDWRNNPTKFKYKISTTGTLKTAEVEAVQEFGIGDAYKYKRFTVEIDRSSDQIASLSSKRAPIFEEATLFLRVLVEGEATLFLYVDDLVTRYFYTLDGLEATQLVYKRYQPTSVKMGINNQYRAQLERDLDCATMPTRKLNTMIYHEKPLSAYFVEYNECQGTVFINYLERGGKDKRFNFSIRPGFYTGGLSITNASTVPSIRPRSASFERKRVFRLGGEAEIILPFHKRKWSVLIEPTFRSFKASSIAKNDEPVSVKYSSVQVPISVRHSFFLGRKSKLFVNAGFALEFSGKSSIDFERSIDLEIKPIGSGVAGIGFQYGGKYSIEVRYTSKRDLLNNYLTWFSEYENDFSIIFGYTLF